MKRGPLLPLAAILALLLAAPAAWAASAGGPKLPAEILSSTGPLSADQAATRNAYIADWMKRLATATDEQVSETRRKLVEPLTTAAPGPFRGTYPQAVLASDELARCLASRRPLVRINTLLLVGEMIEAGAVSAAVPTVTAALADAGAAAVRYLAADAVARMGRSGKLAGPEDGKLLEAVEAALDKEQSSIVTGKLLVAMVHLNAPEASSKVLTRLDGRIADHLKDPKLPLGPAREALVELYIKSVSARSKGTVSDDLMRQICRVVFRYVSLATKLGTEGHREAQPALLEVVRECEQAWMWTAQDLAKIDRGRIKMVSLAVEKDTVAAWADGRLVVLDHWKPIMRDQLKFTDEQMNLE